MSVRVRRTLSATLSGFSFLGLLAAALQLLTPAPAWAASLTPPAALARTAKEPPGGGGADLDSYQTEGKLIASDGVSRDALGEVALSADGTTAVAAASDAKIGSHILQGAIYVFVKPATGWTGGTQTAKLVASDGAAGDQLGPVAVSANGAVIVAGSRATIGANADQGAVYVFVRPAGGWTDGTESAKLTVAGGSANDNLGESVAIGGDGSTVVAGAPGASFLDHSGQGIVYLFPEPGSGWASDTSAIELIANDGQIGDRLGSAVAASGDGATVVAGAPGATVNGHSAQGALYVFAKPAGPWASAPQAAKLTASDGAANDSLGSTTSLSTDGTTAAAGAPAAAVLGQSQQGAAYVFVEAGAAWSSATEQAKLTAGNGAAGDRLASSLAISSDGTTALAGAPGATVNGNIGQGAAFVFDKPGAGWATETAMAELAAPDGASGDSFGYSVSLNSDGSTAVVGAPAAAISGNQYQGAAYVLELVSGGPCVPGPTTLCIDDHPGDRRWAVGVSFSSPQASGAGEAISLSSLGVAEGGLFWFFDASNPEMLLKIIDACALNESFWVFYSATTNVGFSVTVRDSLTGRTRTYVNDYGTAAAPIQDTSAFACIDGDRPALGGNAPQPMRAALAPPPEARPAGAVSNATCTPNAQTLCIADRFELQVDYRSTAAGTGTAIGLDSLGVTQGGLFWFFSAANPEMLVKVLDGCALNDKYWLFYAATTNVGFTLTATDRQTGAVRVYRNAVGTTAPPELDTAAFACN